MSSVTIESRSPQDQSDLVVTTAAASEEEIGTVFARARSAAQPWRQSALERADALAAAAERLSAATGELADLVIREVGKPRTEATQEVLRGVRILRYHAQAALDADGETFPASSPGDPRTLLLARRRPRGVAGLITPWNFPIAIPLWKAAPALAYGNTVVLKPSSYAIGCALRLAEIFAMALPDGVFNVVTAAGAGGRAVAERADVVSFTGSTAVGLSVAQAAAVRSVPAQCEMGGSNASIVLPDADLAAVSQMIAHAAMGYAGQKCTATSRVIVVGDRGAAAEALVAAVEGLEIGDPAEEATVVGPVIDRAARDQVIDAARRAELENGRVLTGGLAAARPGFFVTPAVVDGQTPEATLANEEVFGPIVTVLHAKSLCEAIRISNGVPFGLVTSVFTSDVERVLTALGGLDTGLVRINLPTTGVDFNAPFGGEKRSSVGPREQGKAARELYTSLHTVTIGPPLGS